MIKYVKYASIVGSVALFISLGTVAIASPNRVSNGTTNLKRTGWSSFRAAAVGTILQTGDLLEALDGSAAVSCGSGQKLRLTPRQVVSVSKICGSQRLSLRGNSYDDTAIAGGDDQTIPYVISPRTQWQLESENFTIRWNPVATAKQYTVSLYCVSENTLCRRKLLWTTKTTEPQTTYGGQPLSTGLQYQVVIETDNGLSSRDETAEAMSFEIYDASFRELIEADYEDLLAQDFTDEALTLATADYAVNYDLYSQAIATLETEVESDTEVIAVYQMLARLYAQTGLNLLAKETYETAIQLANAQDDIDALALSQKGLAKVEAQLGNEDVAKELFLASFGNYELLGDRVMTEVLQQDLEKLTDS